MQTKLTFLPLEAKVKILKITLSQKTEEFKWELIISWINFLIENYMQGVSKVAIYFSEIQCFSKKQYTYIKICIICAYFCFYEMLIGLCWSLSNSKVHTGRIRDVVELKNLIADAIQRITQMLESVFQETSYHSELCRDPDGSRVEH